MAPPRVHPIELRGYARLDLLRKLCALGYGVSFLLVGVASLLPDPDPSDHPAFRALAVVFAVLCATLLLGGRLPAPAIKLLAIGGPIVTTSISFAVVRPADLSPIYYVYPAFTSAYFGTRRDAILQVCATATGFALALAASPMDLKVSQFLGVMTVVVIVTWSVSVTTDWLDQLLAQLRDVAATDSLTGLLSREAFGDALSRHLAVRDARAGVVLFDLDHFKSVNDRHGHAEGDAALRRFADVLRTCARRGDLTARWGGEEFIVALPGADEAGAIAWAQRVVDRLREQTADAPVALTTSAGVAMASDGTAPDGVLLAADRALYAAKAAGRDRVVAAALTAFATEA